MIRTRLAVLGVALLQFLLAADGVSAQEHRAQDSIPVWDLNNRSWAVFEHSNNQDSLQAAVVVMEGVMRRVPPEDERFFAFADTYANLLYKVGRVDEAIRWQEKAVQSALREASRLKQGSDGDQAGAKWLETEFSKTLAKMKAGEPTWPQR